MKIEKIGTLKFTLNHSRYKDFASELWLEAILPWLIKKEMEYTSEEATYGCDVLNKTFYRKASEDNDNE